MSHKRSDSVGAGRCVRPVRKPSLLKTSPCLEDKRALYDNMLACPARFIHEEGRSMNSRGQDTTETSRDPRNLTFSQANGYEEIPGPLKLEELSKEARTRIWNLFHDYLLMSRYRSWPHPLIDPWESILRSVHADHHYLPLDEWNSNFESVRSQLRQYIEAQPFNKVFDLIQFVMRQPKCPHHFNIRMKNTFASSRLAYTIDIAPPPTILPAATQEEGETILESLQTLREAGLSGGATHLLNASGFINQGDWAGSIRESIHAVESVARIIDPQASQTLGPALSSIERQGSLHPALKNAFSALYGYTSNEQGIRHALLNGDGTDVGKDEAIFMIGACASFASYLWRKHQANMDA